ncbi:squalene synthetase-like protein [Coemansia aciculifera]|nr:squalene synthetase-like protein [Coemansia aciculifera]
MRGKRVKDDLFVIDTQGTANVPVVPTASGSYECRVVGSTAAPSHTVDSNRIRSLGIRIIDDDISGSRNDRAVPQTHMNKLNAKFVDLDVSSSTSKQSDSDKSRTRRRGKGNKGKGVQSETATTVPLVPKWQRKQRPPIVESDQEMDEIFDDYVSNIDQADLKHLLRNANNRSGYLSRDIGGKVEYSCDISVDEVESSASGTPRPGAFEVDDPFKYEDELHNLLDGGVASSGDDDDGFPDDLDMERLAGPDADYPQTSRQPPPHVRRSQDAALFKEKDRAKSKRGHERTNDGHNGSMPGFDPRTVIKRLDMLALADDLGSIWLQPMSKFERQIVHILAREYNVKSKSHGSGIKRSPVLTQTPSSRKPTNSRRINRILMLYDEGGLIPEQWNGPNPQNASRATGSKGKGRGKGKQQGKGNNKGRGGFTPQPRLDGKMVAENAPEVGSSNIGHKMLQQMGWQPGQGLGVKEEGRATPVDVMIRAGRRGLGA